MLDSQEAAFTFGSAAKRHEFLDRIQGVKRPERWSEVRDRERSYVRAFLWGRWVPVEIVEVVRERREKSTRHGSKTVLERGAWVWCPATEAHFWVTKLRNFSLPEEPVVAAKVEAA